MELSYAWRWMWMFNRFNSSGLGSLNPTGEVPKAKAPEIEVVDQNIVTHNASEKNLEQPPSSDLQMGDFLRVQSSDALPVLIKSDVFEVIGQSGKVVGSRTLVPSISNKLQIDVLPLVQSKASPLVQMCLTVLVQDALAIQYHEIVTNAKEVHPEAQDHESPKASDEFLFERQESWVDLCLHRIRVEPCLFASDFNIIRSDSKRQGGHPRPQVAMDEFNSWIDQGGLINMKTQGSKFSWCNGQQGLSRSWAKLDQQMWVDHPDFLNCVQRVWMVPVAVKGLWKLATKLKQVRVALREWNKRVFGRTTSHIAHLEEQELSSWRRREDIRLAQMTKLKGKLEGDRNSKCFHACLGKKEAEAHFWHDSCERGMFESPEAIHQGAVEYFSSFLQANFLRVLPNLSYLISHVISDEANGHIACIPTMDDIFAALSSIPSNSSPGPNGFGAGFFKSCWKIVKVDIFEAILDFFFSLSKKLPHFYLASYIVLIPKVDVPTGFDKFRPISLYSVFYKICAKILVNQLMGLLTSMISLEQGAFIPSIFENISLMQEMVHSINKKSHDGNIILKGHKRAIKRMTGYSEGSFPFKYLGVPIISGRLKQVHLEETITKVPKSIIKELQFLISTFFWGEASGRVEEGGLGLRHLADMQKALHMRFAWNLIQGNSLWAQFFKAKYVGSKPWLLIDANKGIRFWKMIANYILLVLEKSKWHLREGNLFFWYDKWRDQGPLYSDLPMVGSPLLNVKECPLSNLWDVELLVNLVGQDHVNDILESLAICKGGSDVLVWMKRDSGCFSTKSAWDCIRIRGSTMNWHSRMWHSQLPLKVSVSMWKAWHHAFSVDDHLHRVGCQLFLIVIVVMLKETISLVSSCFFLFSGWYYCGPPSFFAFLASLAS
ncbi:uncharacterized protein LOC122306449 [Carya illinoinensis]|uniref:uncharacterized protein LOC122306449 n=1 Tax=Carya illinoinensis TaxID=32201 RepID=UPI001C7260C4|nr:uncharacterized protein LOC122306449 [Carya illinoinensis]